MKCGLTERRAKKTLPPCSHELEKTYCPVHCRARNKSCRKCERRFTKDERDLEACPECGYQRRCVNHHLKGRRGCRMHLGKRHVGMAHHKFKTGERSRYMQVLSDEQLERYRQMQDAPDYLSLSPDIYAVQLLIEETFTRTRAGESESAWRRAREAFNQFMDAQEKKNREASMSALMELRSALDAGNGRMDALVDLDRLWNRLQRLVESQRRRAIEHGELVQLSIIINMLRFSAECYRQRMKDANIDPITRGRILNEVSTDLDRLTGGAVSALPKS